MGDIGYGEVRERGQSKGLLGRRMLGVWRRGHAVWEGGRVFYMGISVRSISGVGQVVLRGQMGIVWRVCFNTLLKNICLGL